MARDWHAEHREAYTAGQRVSDALAAAIDVKAEAEEIIVQLDRIEDRHLARIIALLEERLPPEGA